MNRRYLTTVLVTLLVTGVIYARYAPEVGIGKMWFCGEFPKPDDTEYGEPLEHVAMNTQYGFHAVGNMVYGEIEELADEIHLHFTVDNNGAKLAHQLTMRVTYDLLIGKELPKNWKMKDYEGAKQDAKWKNILVREMVTEGVGPYVTEKFTINELRIKEERDRCAKQGLYIWGIRALVELLDEDAKMSNNVKMYEVTVSVD